MKIYSPSGLLVREDSQVRDSASLTRASTYYYANTYYSALSSTTLLPTPNTIYAAPITLPRNGALDPIIAFGVTLAAAAGGLGRIGLYSNTSDAILYPNARIFDSGDISTTVVGAKTATLTGITLAPSALYWLAVVFNGSAPNGLRAIPINNVQCGGCNTSFVPVSSGLTVAFTYGALPSTFPAGAIPDTGTTPPRLMLSPNR